MVHGIDIFCIADVSIASTVEKCSSVESNVLLHFLAQYDYSNQAFWKSLFIYCATGSTEYMVDWNFLSQFFNSLAFLK